MGLFDRRAPAHVAPKPRRVTCTKCAFYAYDNERESAYEAVFGHLMTVHVNRRVRTVSPNPGRRALDGLVMSPVTRRFIAAGEAGEGLHLGMPRKRFD